MVTKLAPIKVTKMDVPRIVSLVAPTSTTEKHKYYVGDFVRIVKKDKAFRKIYKQSFTATFEITGLLTLNPPTYSIIDADREPIQIKLFQPELQPVMLYLVENIQQPVWRRFYCSRCLICFNGNSWSKHSCLISDFLYDKIQLAGDWRVALSEIKFPRKNREHCRRKSNCIQLKRLWRLPKDVFWSIVISRPYSGQKIAFMLGTLDTVAQLLATVKRTDGLPHFSFREIKSSGKHEILKGKYEGITIPSEEILSIIGFKGIPDGKGIHNRYKVNPNANRLMKSDETKGYYVEFPADLCPGKHLIFIYMNTS